MEFKKYTSIENHYQAKHIARWLRYHPELADIPYIIEEKIDGANICLMFEPGKPMQVASRNRILNPGDNFYDIWNVLDGMKEQLLEIEKASENLILSYRLYGELYGKGIQKRIDYGSSKYISFFDIIVNDFYFSPCEIKNWCSHYHLLTVPMLGVVNSLQEALDFDVERNTSINPVGGNIAEGIVIKPYDTVILDGGSKTPFYIKKKHPKFAEKPPKKVHVVETGPLVELNNVFKGYINDNRLQGIFSKFGPIKDASEIGQYIRYMLSDAQKDFKVDYADDLENFDKKELKKIFNVGSMIADMLKKEL